jgi:hypothetical protein
MTTFTDGPAKQVRLELQRSPIFLRVVQAPDGTWDALDQVSDQPRPHEKIYVYELDGEPGHVHVQRRGQRGRSCSWMMFANYRLLVGDQPVDDVLRNNSLWQAWAVAEDCRRSAERE